MNFYILKIVITTLLVIAVAEIAKRSTFVGGVLASIPLVSVLAMIWLYLDTKDVEKVSALASSIFWLVIPSLALFLAMPLFLKYGMAFYPAIGLSIAITIGCYFLMVVFLNYFGVKL